MNDPNYYDAYSVTITDNITTQSQKIDRRPPNSQIRI